MAIKRLRLLLLATLLAAVLVGCGAVEAEVSAITDTLVSGTVGYLQGLEEGPDYTFSMTVPDDWVEQFETANTGSRVSFNYVGSDGGTGVPILIMEALSPEQYWEQNGSYPGIYINLANELDTYFVYYIPTYFAIEGLVEEDYQELVDAIPSIVSTFDAEPIE